MPNKKRWAINNKKAIPGPNQEVNIFKISPSGYFSQ